MKRILFILLSLILVACAPIYTDPYSQEAAAQGAIRATQAKLVQIEQEAWGTRQAESSQAYQATAIYNQQKAALELQATQQELDRQQAQATQEYISTSTQQAVVEAIETQQAVKTEFALYPTQTAQAKEADRQDQAATVSHYAGLATRFVIPGGLLALFLGALWVLWANRGYISDLLQAKSLKARTVERGMNKDPLILERLPNGNIVVYDPARVPGSGAVISLAGVTPTGIGMNLGFAQATVTQAQLVDMARVQLEIECLRAAFPKGYTPPIVETLTPSAPQLPGDASWTAFNPVNGLPLGIGPGGQQIIADPEVSPHLLFAGTTGSGKTRYGLRPAIVAALANGWQVVIFDKSGLDFLPFDEHANVTLMQLDDPVQAIQYLIAMNQLITVRQRVLAKHKISTWSRLPDAGPRVLGVFDEFSNLADSMKPVDRNELWRFARMVAAEGRKAGVGLALALQDPSHKSLDLRIRRNTTPVAYRVLDGAASRVILNSNGAEELGKKQFITRQGVDLIHGVAYSPDDDQIKGWLDTHPVRHVGYPEWLHDPEQTLYLSAIDTFNGMTAENVKKVLEMADAGQAQSAIEMAVFGHTGGNAYRRIRAILDDIEGAKAFLNTTTTH